MARAQSFHSDSAICFSTFLHHLPSLSAVQTPQALLQAMEVCPAALAVYITRLNLPAILCLSRRSCGRLAGSANGLVMQATMNTVLAAQKAAGVTEVSLLNFVVSDG